MGKILVTGGTGFIGSHTCVALINAGYQVVIMDNLCNSKVEAIARIEMITGKHVRFYRTDMRDEEDMRQIFEDNKIDAVIHFAGLKAVGESVEKPLEYYENNISGTLSLLRVMREYHCNVIIFSSSATVYGCNNEAPYVEEMPTSATNPYGYTKVMIEQILRDVCTANPEFTAVALRYFNPIGAHISGLLGENPNGIPNNLVPYVAQVALGKLDHVRVFGDDYDTPDGTCRRDFIHVTDLAQAHILAMDYLMNGGESNIFNLGNGVGFTVKEVIDTARKVTGHPIPAKTTPRRAGDPAQLIASSEKARSVLGWHPEHADLEEIIATAWNWHKHHPHGFAK